MSQNHAERCKRSIINSLRISTFLFGSRMEWGLLGVYWVVVNEK